MQTLMQAARLASRGNNTRFACAAAGLAGQPVGGWGETRQARSRLIDEMPCRALRDYTASELIHALFIVGDRYAWRD